MLGISCKRTFSHECSSTFRAAEALLGCGAPPVPGGPVVPSLSCSTAVSLSPCSGQEQAQYLVAIPCPLLSLGRFLALGPFLRAQFTCSAERPSVWVCQVLLCDGAWVVLFGWNSKETTLGCLPVCPIRRRLGPSGFLVMTGDPCQQTSCFSLCGKTQCITHTFHPAVFFFFEILFIFS